MGPFSTRDAAVNAVGQLAELLRDVEDAEVAQEFVRELSRRAIQEGLETSE